MTPDPILISADQPTREELIEALTDHWTQLMATAWQYHEVRHKAALEFADTFGSCPKRICRRAREVAAVADGWFGFQAKADAVNAEMHDALRAFAETLPDDDEPVN